MKKVKPSDTVIKSKSRIEKDTFNIKFVISAKAEDTFAYRAVAFNHWDNAAVKPEYQNYQGATLLIYNETANCIKAVDPPIESTIRETCSEMDGEDPQLNLWKVDKQYTQVKQTESTSQLVKTLEFNYIYCFPGKITIEGKTHRCPMEPFRLKTSKAFNTSDRHHVPSRIISNATQVVAIDLVHPGHFEDDSDTVNELRIFDKMKEGASLTTSRNSTLCYPSQVCGGPLAASR